MSSEKTLDEVIDMILKTQDKVLKILEIDEEKITKIDKEIDELWEKMEELVDLCTELGKLSQKHFEALSFKIIELEKRLEAIEHGRRNHH